MADVTEQAEIEKNDYSSGPKMDCDEQTLSELFNRAKRVFLEAESKPRGDERQSLYMESRFLFEKVQTLTESLNLFSDNETVDDISTNDLKYLLVPAYLAKITLSAECGSNRIRTFTRAQSLLKTYLERVAKYGIGDTRVEQVIRRIESTESNPPDPSLEIAMQNRTDKIEKYKKTKLLESRLDELERRVKSSVEVDDELAREYYIKLIEKWISDSLDSLEREVMPALIFENDRLSASDYEDRSKQSPTPSRMVVSTKPQILTITKNELQKQVFGLGYPSKPVVTVNEFIDKKIKDGDLAFVAQKDVYANSLQRYAEQPSLIREQEELSDAEHEEKEERDDEQELRRKRRWDEFKDDNPRGSGNRHNMG